MGLKLSEYDAQKLCGVLSIGVGLGSNPPYQVLANKETRNFENDYNLLITSSIEKNLDPIKKRKRIKR